MIDSAIARWKLQVEQHHAQSNRAREAAALESGDFWRNVVSQFREDPHRSGDAVLNRLLQEVDTTRTVLDVGGGAGRFALPLALRCKAVTVVEPSAAMAAGLREGAREAGINNVVVVPQGWEEAEVAPADLVLCAHVVYGVADIEPFIRKFSQHAREKVLILSYFTSPPSLFAPFWEVAHREKRVTLPALPELLPVLWEMGFYPNVEMVETLGRRTVPNREAALQTLRRFLFLKPDSEADRRMQAAMDDLLVETPEGITVQNASPRPLALVSWQP